MYHRMNRMVTFIFSSYFSFRNRTFAARLLFVLTNALSMIIYVNAKFFAIDSFKKVLQFLRQFMLFGQYTKLKQEH